MFGPGYWFSSRPVSGGANVWPMAAAYLGTAAISAASAYRTNRQEMGFARDMSNTSWQRAVADMKAAGINPMVAFQQGGASTPTVQLDNPAEGLSEGMLNSVRVMNEMKMQRAQIGLIEKQGALAEAQADAIGKEVGMKVEGWDLSGRELAKRALTKWDNEMANLEASTSELGLRRDLHEVDKRLKEAAEAGAQFSAEQFKFLMDMISSLPDWMQGPARFTVWLLGQTGTIPAITYGLGRSSGKSSVKEVPVPGPTHMRGGDPALPSWRNPSKK